jgi:hypothetical protein
MPMIIASAVMMTGTEADETGIERGARHRRSSARRSRAKEITSTLFAVATPMHMIAPVSAGTDSVVRGEQHPHDARPGLPAAR